MLLSSRVKGEKQSKCSVTIKWIDFAVFVQWSARSSEKQQTTATYNMNEYHKSNVESESKEYI